MKTPVSSLSVPRNSEQLELEPISPQSLVSKFWSDYHSQAPRKVISVLPPILYESLADSESPSSTLKALSYEETAQQCRSDVWAIIKECERTNKKLKTFVSLVMRIAAFMGLFFIETGGGFQPW
jgi:hypothetical protein